MIILADPMQLIYGFRGSTPSRLQRHLDECEKHIELRTPHRWHDSQTMGTWLLDVRARLQGSVARIARPAAVKIVRPQYPGLDSMKPVALAAASRAFKDGRHSVAVLAAINADVVKLRGYLARHKMHPRHLGGSDAFEMGRSDIEDLRSTLPVGHVARRLLERLASLVPSLSSSLVSQVRARLKDGSIDRKRAGAEARELLDSIAPLYSNGAHKYCVALTSSLDLCRKHGHTVPPNEITTAVRATASLSAKCASIEAAMAVYSGELTRARFTAPRYPRGLFVMTAHQAKGKEFDVVVLVNASKYHLPDDDEHRRLFYVVLTRAQHEVVVIVPPKDASPLISLI